MMSINSIFQAATDTETIIKGFCRLLGVDDNNLAYMIQLDIKPLQGPFAVQFHELITEIEEGRILANQEFDCSLPATIDQLSNSASKAYEESVFKLTKLLSAGAERILFDADYRAQKLAKYAGEFNLNERTLRRLYYRYLWGGQTEQAIAPKYQDRGTLGDVQKEGTKRRGCKPKESALSIITISTPQVREMLRKGATRFYMPGSRTLKKAFVKTLKKFFSKGVKVLNSKNGKAPRLEEILLPAEQLPTERQFRYICEQLEIEKGKRTKLPGRLRPRKAEVILIGRARDGVRGPGHRFEIDATKLQIKLVSRYGRERIVGNPILYVIIDCWSGAYVGYALSLHDASWALAASALFNCFTHKGEVFRRLNLNYEEEDWFCHHFPSLLTADRAELISDKSGNVPYVGITVEIMPPMRPDRKGKVESAIKDIKHRRSLVLPGSYPKFPQRRESNGNDTAALTLEELEIIIVDSIIGLNNEPVPIAHIPPEMLRDGDNDVTHIELYKWGLKHLPGFTRTMDPITVYTNLMTRATASLTTRGIYFMGETYKSNQLANASYTTINGKNKIEIRYDEHHADQVWFFDKISKKWVPAISDNENVRRLKAAFYELECFREDAKIRREKAKLEMLHQQDERDQEHTIIIKNARKEAKTAKLGRTKKQNKENVKNHKAVENLATDLLNSDRATTSVVTALINSKNHHLPQSRKNEQDTPPPLEGVHNESITQRSKNLWRAHDNLDK